jgi:hypothetical protein
MSDSTGKELPRWILGHWIGPKYETTGRQMFLDWIDQGSTLEGVMKLADSTGVHEFRRFSIAIQAPADSAAKLIKILLRLDRQKEQYLFSGYINRSYPDHLMFGDELKWRHVNSSHYIGVVIMFMMNSELIIIEKFGPQHGAMVEQSYPFKRAQ